MKAHWLVYSSALLLLFSATPTSFTATVDAQSAAAAQITILYDAFGKSSAMQKDWGYSALIEYGGKRILFDTATTPTFLPRTPRPRASTCRSWTLLSCRTDTAITWEAWPTC